MSTFPTKPEDRCFVVSSDLTPVDSEFLTAAEIAEGGKRMWLFQVPKDVNIQDLNGVKISWKKNKSVQVGEKLYEVSKDVASANNLSVVVSEQEEGPVLLSGAISGVVTLSRVINIPEVVVPDAREMNPAAGLDSARQRFLPFGSDDVITTSKVRKKDKKTKKKEPKDDSLAAFPSPTKKKKKKKAEKRHLEDNSLTDSAVHSRTKKKLKAEKWHVEDNSLTDSAVHSRTKKKKLKAEKRDLENNLTHSAVHSPTKKIKVKAEKWHVEDNSLTDSIEYSPTKKRKVKAEKWHAEDDPSVDIHPQSPTKKKKAKRRKSEDST